MFLMHIHEALPESQDVVDLTKEFCFPEETHVYFQITRRCLNYTVVSLLRTWRRLFQKNEIEKSRERLKKAMK